VSITVSRVALFCGSSGRASTHLLSAAQDVGRLLAQRGIGILYGAAPSGLMGAAADAALSAGGEVIGVMPQMRIDRKLAHARLTRLIPVANLRERQDVITSMADGFLILPGGYGTCEELFDVLTWTQLGLFDKRVVIFNVMGFFDLILRWIDRASDDGLIHPSDSQLFRVVGSVEEIAAAFSD
jgi:uncharacterized protein (TIGR00730 family)